MFLLYILITALILTVLVVVHEYGHFLAAKKCGVTVEEFAIGMGPAIYKKQGKETLFTVRAFLIGGFVRMLGEDSETTEDEQTQEQTEALADPGNYQNKTPMQRFMILAAGVTMNFILGYLILYFLYIYKGFGFLGSFSAAWMTFIDFAGLIFKSLGMLFTGQIPMSEMAGPIGIVSIVGDYYNYGVVMLLLFTAMLSVNLGIMNLIPLPALDGGQMFILLIEAIIRRPLSDKMKAILINLSFVLLFGFMILISIQDVSRLFQGS